MATLSGIVGHCLFRNDENGYTVTEVISDGNTCMVVGILPVLAEGEQAEFDGDWVEHPQYGRLPAAACRLRPRSRASRVSWPPG